MNITLLDDFTIESMCLARSGEDRTPGLHLSDVIKAIMLDIDPKTYGSTAPMDMNRIEPGFTFEVLMEEAFARRDTTIVRVGEVELDGVIMSPDGLDPGDPPTLLETKLTWKSSRTTPRPCTLHKASLNPPPGCRFCVHEFGVKFLPWMIQMQSYAKALNINHGVLRALFVNDDYDPAGTPAMYSWHFAWEQAELDRNWQLILTTIDKKGLRAKH